MLGVEPQNMVNTGSVVPDVSLHLWPFGAYEDLWVGYITCVLGCLLGV